MHRPSRVYLTRPASRASISNEEVIRNSLLLYKLRDLSVKWYVMEASGLSGKLHGCVWWAASLWRW